MTEVKSQIKDDWRRQGQEYYLKGIKLFLKNIDFDKTDHEHCEFCNNKFSSQDCDFNKGYTTKDNYYWVCEKCYVDFKDEFDW